MAKVTLDHLRKGGVTRGLPERTYQLCLRRDLLAEVDAKTNELRDAVVEEATATAVENPDNAPPQRMAPPPESAKVAEIRAQLGALYDEMEDATGDLRLRAIADGAWRQWVNAHPPREDHARDEQVAYGICNADDLADDLGRWVLSWDGDLLASEDWAEHIAPLCSGGDLKSLVSLILEMQEAVEDPKLRRLALLGARMSSDAASQPEPSDAPLPSTSDESQPSDTNTTTPTAT